MRCCRQPCAQEAGPSLHICKNFVRETGSIGKTERYNGIEMFDWIARLDFAPTHWLVYKGHCHPIALAESGPDSCLMIPRLREPAWHAAPGREGPDNVVLLTRHHTSFDVLAWSLNLCKSAGCAAHLALCAAEYASVTLWHTNPEIYPINPSCLSHSH